MAEGEVVTRFASLNDEELDQLLDGKDSKSTKNVISVSRKVLNDYLRVKDGPIKSVEQLDSAPLPDIVATLRKFYGEVRKSDGSLYAKKSLITLRFGLQKHFLQSNKLDIIKNEQFDDANVMFKAAMVQIKKEAKGVVNHKEPITTEDLQKLYQHNNFSLATPETLQKRVFFEYLYYFCKRGRENIRDVQRTDFEMKTDAKGLRYVQIKMVRQTKNHRGDDLRDVDDKDGRMYEIPGHINCPVKAFTKYYSRLHPDCNDFWQRPKRIDRVAESDNVWYDNVPVGKNTLGNIMAKLSIDCGLSKRYTNHCVRSTCITVLDNSGIETRHIIGLSGHKSETSFKSYCKRLSDTKKREMSEILSENVTRIVDNSGTKNADVDLLADDVDVNAILQDITNYEGNMGQGNATSVSNTLSSTKTLSLQSPSFGAAHGFFIGQISNSNINFHFHK